MNNSLILECQHVSKIVQTAEDDITILHDVSLDVNRGETIAIVGQSGSGKTTLLSLLAGLDTPSAGNIIIAGTSIAELSEDQRADVRQQTIGFVFQAFHLLPGFTALENVMLPLDIANKQQTEQQAEQLLARVGMSHRLHHYPTTLSGGEQQRVAIARAFATCPPLLLADEPTGNLDTDTGSRVIDLLFELNSEQKTTLVLVTHDDKLAERCDKRYRLVSGELLI